MARILSLSLRPRRLSDFIGQNATVASLRKQMVTRRPKAFMFIGPSGCGKTSVARIIAVSLQCDHQSKDRWGDPCAQCYEADWANAIHEINASDANGVDELGKIAEMARYKPLPPAKERVVILDESHRMSSAGQNLLLKHFEDPSPTTTWMMCSTEPQKILPTLRRRCATYQLRGLRPSEAEVLLKRAASVAKIEQDLQPLLSEFISQHIQSPALMLMALERYAAGTPPTQAVNGTDTVSTDTLLICQAVAQGKTVELRRLLSNASAEDSRWIQSSVAGYLRSMLFGEKDMKRAMVLADSMVELCSGTSPLDDKMLYSWLIGRLFKIAIRMRG